MKFLILFLCMKVLLIGGGYNEQVDRFWTDSTHVDNIAIVKIKGALSNDAWRDDRKPESIAKILRSAIEDDTISAIVLDIESPGGEVKGTQELIDAIKTSKKKIVTFARQMESGALWVGLETDYIYAQSDFEAVIGSVGAYLVHRSDKEMDKIAGQKFTIIQSKGSPAKTWGNMYEDLSEEAKQHFQDHVDMVYEKFVSSIKKARPKISNDALDGRSFTAEKALALNIVDKIGTLQDAIEKAKALGAKNTPTPAPKNQFNYSYNMNFLSKLFGGTKAESVVPPVAVPAQTETTLTEEQMAAKVEAELARLNAQVSASDLAYNTLSSSLVTAMQGKAQADAENATLKAQIAALQAENAKLKNSPADEPTQVGVTSTGVGSKAEAKKSWEQAPWNKDVLSN